MNRVTMILILIGLLFIPDCALADGGSYRENQQMSGANRGVGDETPAGPSDAQFDKRLPPVLPGERVKDSNRRMKVWSSAGPVPVQNQAPTAPQPGVNNTDTNVLEKVDDIDVFIDKRRGSPSDTVGIDQ